MRHAGLDAAHGKATRRIVAQLAELRGQSLSHLLSSDGERRRNRARSARSKGFPAAV